MTSVFRLQKMSSRRLQDVLVKTNMFALALRLQKMSSRRLGQDQYIRLDHTSSRRLQEVLKTFWRRLQDIFKTSSRRPQNVFKTSSKPLAKISSRRFQDSSSSKLFLLTPLWETFNMFMRRSFSKKVIYRGICLSNATSGKFMASEPNLQ